MLRAAGVWGMIQAKKNGSKGPHSHLCCGIGLDLMVSQCTGGWACALLGSNDGERGLDARMGAPCVGVGGSSSGTWAAKIITAASASARKRPKTTPGRRRSLVALTHAARGPTVPPVMRKCGGLIGPLIRSTPHSTRTAATTGGGALHRPAPSSRSNEAARSDDESPWWTSECVRRRRNPPPPWISQAQPRM